MTAADLPADGATGSLDGLRVLDLSRVLAGPYAGQLLADHGAAVLKVEGPAGDDTRAWGPPFEGDTASYFVGLNRGKRNICVDLGSAVGRDVVRSLLASTDVLIENFNAGTMERWGLGPDELLAAFPQLVYCRISGYGGTGPQGGRPGYDAILQASSGLMSVNGPSGGPAERVGIPVVDQTTGLHAFSGILLALLERERSGHGQLVEATLLDTGIGLLHPHAAAWFASGAVPGPVGSGHASIVPYQPFDTLDGAVFIAAGNDRQFARLCAALGLDDVADDPRFATNADRVRHRVDLVAALSDAMSGLERSALLDELASRGVPAGPVNDIAEALEDDQVAWRERIVSIGDYRGVASPVSMSRTPPTYSLAPRAKGADTARVLEELGWSAAEVAASTAELDESGSRVVGGAAS